jgi:hypothetical protein
MKKKWRAAIFLMEKPIVAPPGHHINKLTGAKIAKLLAGASGAAPVGRLRGAYPFNLNAGGGGRLAPYKKERDGELRNINYAE